MYWLSFFPNITSQSLRELAGELFHGSLAFMREDTDDKLVYILYFFHQFFQVDNTKKLIRR
jgi:hypothetical protein